jgi:hypothetical protein
MTPIVPEWTKHANKDSRPLVCPWYVPLVCPPGDLTSTELRTTATTATTTYDWTNGLLTSIVDPYGRSVDLAYTNGLLTSITNFAGSVWSLGYAATALPASQSQIPAADRPSGRSATQATC